METPKRQRLRQIPVADISPNPENPRIIFRQNEMESLMLSIDKHGIKVPIVVYREGERFHLIDGERRWRCARKLNHKLIPALIQDKPTELENLLLMYNVHALREQWDYFTTASKLGRIIELFEAEHGHEPNESELSEATGLSHGAIRRCRLLLNLPYQFQKLLLKELELPKTQQRLSEDFFIEMERALKAVTRRLPQYEERLDSIRHTLIDKFRRDTIAAVTDFRQLSKIATAVDKLGLAKRQAERALDRLFEPDNRVGIREIYERTVQFEYDEKKASRGVDLLIDFIDEIIEDDRKGSLDDEFVEKLKRLYESLRAVLRDR